MSRLYFTLLISLLLISCNEALSQRVRWIDKRKAVIRGDTIFYFYKGLRYGVQDLYNPAYLIANGGFDVLQLQGFSRKVFEYDWRLNTKNVTDNLLDPFTAIRKVGWGKYLTTEVFPLNWTPEGGQWIPNYFLHLLGSGMEYRMMTEWYRYHKVPVPKVFAVVTLFSMHFVNEVIENGDKVGPNTDPITDWYIFDVAGVLLFNSVKVSRFFSETLHMADWSSMPTITFPDFTLLNSGQYFIYKYEIPRNPKWAIFSRWGMGTQAGITYKIKNENALTIAAGGRSYKYRIIQEEGKVATTSLTWLVFLAWDKNNTPLVTLALSGTDDYTVLANVYPGVIKLGKFSPGVWAVAGKNGTGAFGICARYTLGIGVGYGKS